MDGSPFHLFDVLAVVFFLLALAGLAEDVAATLDGASLTFDLVQLEFACQLLRISCLHLLLQSSMQLFAAFVHYILLQALR